MFSIIVETLNLRTEHVVSYAMYPVADPGFPVGGVVDPLGGHGPPMWALFTENVCKNERIESRRGGACAGHASLDPPMVSA